MGVFRDVIGMPVGLPATDAMLEVGACMLRTETELVTKSRWAAPVDCLAQCRGARLGSIGFTEVGVKDICFLSFFR